MASPLGLGGRVILQCYDSKQQQLKNPDDTALVFWLQAEAARIRQSSFAAGSQKSEATFRKCLLTSVFFFCFFFFCILVPFLPFLLPQKGNSAHKISFFFFFLFFNVCLFYFLAVVGLHCFAWVLPSCGEQGLLFIVPLRLLTAMASLVAEHRFQARGLRSVALGPGVCWLQ